MRNREEIEKKMAHFDTQANQRLMIEVLLDIRDAFVSGDEQ